MYAICCPHIARSFKNTYHKDIIIFRATPVIVNQNRVSHYDLSNPLKLVKNKWKSINKSGGPCYGNRRVYSPEDMATIPLGNDILLFSSFNHAYVAKCILLERLRAEYLKALVELQTRMEHNCPDVKADPLMFSEHHPEHFI